MNFAFYGRVSTEDHQNPHESRLWQMDRSVRLITPVNGIVVREFFDVGQSRSIPWKRRPEASKLLEALADPNRGFEAVVIAEPQRAFYGGQYAEVAPIFEHYGVELWVPEAGGRIDFKSEAQELLMAVFGGMSKGERTRVKTRVRSSMTAQAAAGRYLGGRPPYGYQLLDVGPHPNPEKARDGKRLHQLGPDPVTAPVVRRIFDEYLEGRGYLAIAERLTADGLASPSGHDRERNRHRHGLAWGKSAVRAILSNPRYTGYEVWAKQRRDEVLLDVEDVSAGHQTVMRWNAEERWVWSAQPVHDALVSMETFRAVQARMVEARRGSKPRRGPKTERPYLVRGRLTCGLCRRKLQGSWHHGEPYYRCAYGTEYARSAKLDHPKVVYLRERDLLPRVDAWLGRIFDPEHIDETCEAIIGAVDEDASITERAAAQAAIKECDRKLDRYRTLLETGTDAALVAQWIGEVQTERRRAEAVVEAATQSSADGLVTAAEVRDIIDELGGLVGLLNVSDAKLRSRFYEEVGFSGTYDPLSRSVDASADIGVRKVRVGGGT